jgi:hypothetical protein
MLRCDGRTGLFFFVISYRVVTWNQKVSRRNTGYECSPQITTTDLAVLIVGAVSWAHVSCPDILSETANQTLHTAPSLAEIVIAESRRHVSRWVLECANLLGIGRLAWKLWLKEGATSSWCLVQQIFRVDSLNVKIWWTFVNVVSRSILRHDFVHDTF